MGAQPHSRGSRDVNFRNAAALLHCLHARHDLLHRGSQTEVPSGTLVDLRAVLWNGRVPVYESDRLAAQRLALEWSLTSFGAYSKAIRGTWSRSDCQSRSVCITCEVTEQGVNPSRMPLRMPPLTHRSRSCVRFWLEAQSPGRSTRFRALSHLGSNRRKPLQPA